MREPCTHLQEEHSAESTVKCKGPEVRACREFEVQQEAVRLTSEKDHSPCCAGERLMWAGREVGEQVGPEAGLLKKSRSSNVV